ncbi:hypothetical protein ES705_08701 [subsurface metagenome]
MKHLSLEELEEAIEVKKTELKGLISTEGCVFIIANELGIQEMVSGNEFLEPKDDIKTVREGFEEALKHDYFDKGLYKYLDNEDLEEIKINIDSKDLKREIEEYGKIDIDEMDIASKNLEKALENDDTPERWLAFKKFQFWLALRQIPIKTVDLYMYMGKNRGLGISFQNLAFKNTRFRSYIFIDENRVDIDYKNHYNFVHNLGEYAKKEKSLNIGNGIIIKEKIMEGVCVEMYFVESDSKGVYVIKETMNQNGTTKERKRDVILDFPIELLEIKIIKEFGSPYGKTVYRITIDGKEYINSLEQIRLLIQKRVGKQPFYIKYGFKFKGYLNMALQNQEKILKRKTNKRQKA